MGFVGVAERSDIHWARSFLRAWRAGREDELGPNCHSRDHFDELYYSSHPAWTGGAYEEDAYLGRFARAERGAAQQRHRCHQYPRQSLLWQIPQAVAVRGDLCAKRRADTGSEVVFGAGWFH